MDDENTKTAFYDLTAAANYMDLEGLLHLCCAKLATLIRGKTVEQVRQLFGIVNDFTPEEEQKIREENKEWLPFAGEPEV
ncbi:MAG: SKP1 family protein [Pseudomonadota bacterium]